LRLHLLSSDPFSSLTLPTPAFPSVHIVGSLTSKFPSGLYMYIHNYIYMYIYIYGGIIQYGKQWGLSVKTHLLCQSGKVFKDLKWEHPLHFQPMELWIEGVNELVIIYIMFMRKVFAEIPWRGCFSLNQEN
jgi:hypothetical protein